MTDALARTCSTCGEPFPDKGEKCPACGGKPRPARVDPFLLAESGAPEATKPAAAAPATPEPAAPAPPPPTERVVEIPLQDEPDYEDHPAEEPADEPVGEDDEVQPAGDTVRMSLGEATKAWLEDTPDTGEKTEAPPEVPSIKKPLLITLGIVVVVLIVLMVVL